MFGRLTHKIWICCDTARRLSAAAGVSRSSTFVDIVQHRHRELLSTLDAKIDAAFEEKEQLNKKIGPATLQKFESLSQRCLNTEKVILVPIGSLVYGLGYQQSDYDSVLFVKNKKERDAFMQIIHSNQDLRGALFESLSALIGRNSPEILNKEVSRVIPLTFLKIPLLVIEFTDGSSIDISIPDNDFQAIRNSNLVRYYLKADKRFGKMLLYIRRLFEECGVKNSKAGLLSNYHIVMTIVHFLQSEQSLTPWQVLPVLCQTHPSLVGRDLPIEQIIRQLAIPISNLTFDYQSNNKMHVSELLIRYFDYYSRFNFTKEAIHIEQGQARRMSRKSIGDEQRLMIIDPYSHGTKSFVSLAGECEMAT
ncbi:unnamed protein product, partial [Mesorhabditis belari]|uniref:PAP-associated domain-containing protein n=1 Tax=Mesorhabditis belari TaxID=2138241 RepID=A0AAF3EWM2_9BILA